MLILETISMETVALKGETDQCIHKFGHIADKCYKLHWFQPSFKFKGKNPMAHQVYSTQLQESLPFTSSTIPSTPTLHNVNLTNKCDNMNQTLLVSL